MRSCSKHTHEYMNNAMCCSQIAQQAAYIYESDMIVTRQGNDHHMENMSV